MLEMAVAEKKTVGLMADAGLPFVLAEKLRSSTADLFGSSLDPDVEWIIEIEQQSLPLDADGEVELDIHSQDVRDRLGWDYLIYLTDLPKYTHSEPMISSVDAVHGSAMIVLPALGLMRTGRVNRALLQTVGALHGAATSRPSGADDTVAPTNLRPPENVTSDSDSDTDSDADSGRNTYQTLKGFRGRAQLLAGMVRGSRPWRILPGLSGVMAAATATGSFGVFYTSIWSMADYLSSPRLASISLLSIAIMAIWLIAHNDLWERPVVGGRRTERRVSYNLATVITMLLAVAAMYVGLFTAIFGGALIVINSDYLAVQLGHPVSVTEYLNLAWLSASLGTIAGALGSSLDNEQAVKKATFSSREYDRRQLSKNREKAPGKW